MNTASSAAMLVSGLLMSQYARAVPARSAKADIATHFHDVLTHITNTLALAESFGNKENGALAGLMDLYGGSIALADSIDRAIATARNYAPGTIDEGTLAAFIDQLVAHESASLKTLATIKEKKGTLQNLVPGNDYLATFGVSPCDLVHNRLAVLDGKQKELRDMLIALPQTPQLRAQGNALAMRLDNTFGDVMGYLKN